jgi:hypothetical protein
MRAYDLDGTLADTNFALQNRLSLAQIFTRAAVLLVPDEDFIVITARPHSTTTMRQATVDWLQKNQPNYRGIYYVSGSETQIIKAKADIIDRLNITDFYDNNPDIVAELRKQTKATIHKV